MRATSLLTSEFWDFWGLSPSPGLGVRSGRFPGGYKTKKSEGTAFQPSRSQLKNKYNGKLIEGGSWLIGTSQTQSLHLLLLPNQSSSQVVTEGFELAHFKVAVNHRGVDNPGDEKAHDKLGLPVVDVVVILDRLGRLVSFS